MPNYTHLPPALPYGGYTCTVRHHLHAFGYILPSMLCAPPQNPCILPWNAARDAMLADDHMLTRIPLCDADLCLHADMVAPFPYQQLTRLRLQSSYHSTKHVLAMISALPRLEELAIALDSTFDVFALDTAALSQWPQLRLMDLSESRLWEYYSAERHKVLMRAAPRRVVDQLMHLQRACPRIKWVVRHISLPQV